MLPDFFFLLDGILGECMLNNIVILLAYRFLYLINLILVVKLNIFEI